MMDGIVSSNAIESRGGKSPLAPFNGDRSARGKIKTVYALDSDKMKFRYTTKERAGGNGFGLSFDNVCFTLNTIDRHMVAIVYGKRKHK